MEIINDFLDRLNGSIRQCEYSINKNNSRIAVGDNSKDKELIGSVLSNIDNGAEIENNIVTIRKYSTEENNKLLNAFLKQYRMLKTGIRDKMFACNKEKIENTIKKAYDSVVIVDLEKLNEDNRKNKDRIDKMNYLALKIKNYTIDENDLASINHFCKLFNINTLELVSEIVIEALKEPYGYVSSEEVEPQIVKQNEALLTTDDLINLFNAYGCEFEKLSKDKKDKLIKYGNIDKMKNIMDTFKNYGVDLSASYRGGTVFTNALCIDIFIYSSANDVKKTLDGLKAYNLLSFDESLIDSLKHLKIFLPRKSKYREKYIGNNGKESFKEVSGVFEDFNDNLKYFYDIYKSIMRQANLNIKDSDLLDDFRKNIYNNHVDSFETPHDKIKNIIKIFEAYGISARQYIMTISCFRKTSVASVFDKMLEIDCFYYIANNLTKLSVKGAPESLIFAKQSLGWDNDDLFKTYADNSIFRVYPTKPVLSSKKLNEALAAKGIDPKRDKLVSSYIPEDKKIVFADLKETVDTDFNSNMMSFFNNYDYFKKVVNDKGFEYYDAVKKYISNDNPLVLDIDGILVSLNKLIRVYSIYNNHSMVDSKDKLLFAIIYNSHYSKEQVDIIKKCIDELVLGEKGKELTI